MHVVTDKVFKLHKTFLRISDLLYHNLRAPSLRLFMGYLTIILRKNRNQCKAEVGRRESEKAGLSFLLVEKVQSTF